MKYLQIIPSGFSLHEDSASEVPEGAVPLSAEDFEKLRSGEFNYIGGQIVPAESQ